MCEINTLPCLFFSFFYCSFSFSLYLNKRFNVPLKHLSFKHMGQSRNLEESITCIVHLVKCCVRNLERLV